MKERLLIFWSKADKFTAVPILFSIFCILFIIIFFLIFYAKLPNKLPLFYSLQWGEAQLGSKQQFFLLPAILLFVLVINSFLSIQLHPIQAVLKRVLMFSLILVDLIVLITALKILFIFI